MNDETPVIQDSPTSGAPSPQPDAGGEAAPKKKRSKAGAKAAEKAATAALEARVGHKFSDPALLLCVQEMGVDRILFAVDYPFEANAPGPQWLATVPLCDEDKAKIASGNAKRLLRM